MLVTESAGHDHEADVPGPDSAELGLLCAGDERAFAALVDRYGAAMLRFAEARVNSRAVAEEVVQETWLAVYEGIGRFEERSSLRTWLFRILFYRCVTRRQQERRSVPMSALVADADAAGGVEALEERRGARAALLHDAPRSPEERILGQEARTRIDAAIAELPTRQQGVIVLRDLEGWAPEEVCRALGVSPGHQRVLLHRARATVRCSLAGYFTEV